MSDPGLFMVLLGERFARLAPRVREVHGCGSARLQGLASVTRGRGPLVQLICRLASLPPSQPAAPVQVEITIEPGGESWVRRFNAGAPMSSRLQAVRGLLVERLGAVELSFSVEEKEAGIDWQLQRIRICGVPVPRRFVAHSVARSFEDSGRYHFEVEVALHLIGPLIAYRGAVHGVQHVDDAPRVATAASGDPAAIVVFDGQCMLCSRWTSFLLRRDRARRLHFAAMQGTAGRALLRQHGLNPEDPATFLLLVGGGPDRRAYVASEGVLRIVEQLGGPWRLVGLARIVPPFLRDWLYARIARSRYAWFGRRAQCYAPQASERHRFLA